jgi:hypothetical protein
LCNGVQPVLASRDLGRDVQLRLVLLRLVGRLRSVQQRGDLRLQLGLGLEHVTVAHGLVAAGVGLDLGAVHGDGAQLHEPHLARQAHDLHEQFAQLLQMEGAEVTDRSVRREVARAQHPEGDVLVQLVGDLARAEHPAGVGVHEHLDHHGGVERLVARPAVGVALVERTQVQAIDSVTDEVGQVPLGQPVLQCLGQQHLLLRVVG